MLNYDELEIVANEFKPKILIVGASAYPRDFDYARFRKIADGIGAYLMADIAHISGLVATEEHNDPFKYADIVTTTTHKTLRGPRAGMIFFKLENEEKINFAVFPQLQGGPHNNQIAGVATQLKEVASPTFKKYCQQVKKNARALSQRLIEKGHKLVSNGTDNHLMLWDVRPHGLTGSKIEKASDFSHITLNKNTIAGDKS